MTFPKTKAVARPGRIMAFRLDEASYEKFKTLAGDMGLSSSQTLGRCLEAIFEMLESGHPVEPAMVQAVRSMRKNGTTFAAKPRTLAHPVTKAILNRKATSD